MYSSVSHTPILRLLSFCLDSKTGSHCISGFSHTYSIDQASISSTCLSLLNARIKDVRHCACPLGLTLKSIYLVLERWLSVLEHILLLQRT